MAAQIGRKMRVYRDGNIIAGVQSKTMTLDNEPVDTTSDDDEGFRSMLADPAVKSITIACSGVTKDAGLRAQAVAGENLIFDNINLVFEDGSYIEGSFFFANYEEQGEQGEAVKFSCQLQNAGAFSLVAADVPANEVPPAVAGVAQVGQTLTVWPGEWDGFGDFEYKWQEDDGGYADISGATSRTYVPVVGLVGNPLRAGVRRVNSAGASAWVYSQPTAAVIAA
jgi:predicted secreted protein